MPLIKNTVWSLLVILSVAIPTVNAQRPEKPNAAEILLKLQKLNFLGTVLYVAAHPDDENTRLIAYLANARLARTAYLSLTRGDGGQNLIGPEIREGLGLIRTQELLAARRIDGGRQFFSRANDFGYSKSTEETQKIWDSDEVLSDMVWVYRNFRPDVIITRFPPDKRAGHGHHTTSAIFAEKAMELSGNSVQYPEQLKYVSPWKPRRLYLNTGRWWNPNITGEEPGVLTFNVGTYNPLLGESYTEIAARSRSQHKSQGFGSTGVRGEMKEFLELRKGDPADQDLFDGIDTSWGRVKGGKNIEKLINTAINEYKSSDPSASLPLLLSIRDEITKLSDDHWKRIKLEETNELIKAVLGLYLEVKADDYQVSPGEYVQLNVEAVNRSDKVIKLKSVNYAGLSDTTLNADLADNIRLQFSAKLEIPADFTYSDPYWLKEAGSLGMYKVEDYSLRGTPENEPSLSVSFELEISGRPFIYQIPVIHKWNDPVNGELYRPFNIVPPVFVNIQEGVYIFPDENAKKVEVSVKSGKANLLGKVALELPEGWKSAPASYDVDLVRKGEEATFTFDVLPPKYQNSSELKAYVAIGNDTYDLSQMSIEYDHIPTQLIMPQALAKMVKINIERRGDLVGYIQGAGDAIPAALREIGYEVWELKEEEIIPENLAKLDAVVLGVRALNTNDRIGFYMPRLLDYVKNGGTLVSQYNTNRRLKTNNFAPYPIELSRARVAEEDAEVRILNPEHELLNVPNKITLKDFDGWVQERGLYFPGSWDDKYEALLSSNDKGEKARNGGLLVAKYGKGYYIYNGYSMFRELPAGVPGAFRLFVNMVSLGNEMPQKIKYGHNQD